MNSAWLLILLPLSATSGWWFAVRKSKEVSQTSLDFDQSCLMGINHLLENEDDEALAEFLKTMDQQPKSVELQIVLGNLCRRRGEYERASLIHQAILNNSSHSAQTRGKAQFELAQDYQAAGWLDRAESLYVELLENELYQSDTALNLLKIYQHQNDWLSAVRTAKTLKKLGSWTQKRSEQLAHFYCELCEESINQGRFPDAETYLNEALKDEPNNARIIILSGRVAAFKGDHQSAIGFWNKLLLSAPSYTGVAVNHIRDSYQIVGSKSDYLVFLKRAVKACDDPAILSELLDVLKSERYQNAGRFLLQYLKGNPNIAGLKQILMNWQDVPTKISHEELLFLVETMTELVQGENRYQCGGCGYKASSFEWSCPSCLRWGSHQRNTIRLTNNPLLSEDQSETGYIAPPAGVSNHQA